MVTYILSTSHLKATQNKKFVIIVDLILSYNQDTKDLL